MWWYLVRITMIIIGVPATWFLFQMLRHDVHILYIIGDLMLVIACALTYIHAYEQTRRER